jgi:hypothetical protein
MADTDSILDALADPELFAPHFKGPSWKGWKVFLAALFALPMDDDAAQLFRQCTGRSAQLVLNGYRDTFTAWKRLARPLAMMVPADG